jgi:DNA-binding beta-propeller fold protein YncE
MNPAFARDHFRPSPTPTADPPADRSAVGEGSSSASSRAVLAARPASVPSAARVLIASALALLGVLALAAPALAAEVHLFDTSFGSAGSGNGQLALTEHSGLAVNPSSGAVYVADTGNGRVEQFEADGTFVRTVGSLTHPLFVVIDASGGPSDGDLYVADTATGTVSKFSASGALVSAWGTNGQLDGSTSTGGAFSEIGGIAVSASGELFVLSAGTRMTTFDQSANFLTEFNIQYPAAPAGFALDDSSSSSAGDIYTRYASGPETLKFDSSGAFLSEPDLGSGTGLAVDPTNGDLYVDYGTEVHRYDASGTPLESFGSTEAAGGALSSGQGLSRRRRLLADHLIHPAERRSPERLDRPRDYLHRHHRPPLRRSQPPGLRHHLQLRVRHRRPL